MGVINRRNVGWGSLGYGVERSVGEESIVSVRSWNWVVVIWLRRVWVFRVDEVVVGIGFRLSWVSLVRCGGGG